MTSPTRILLHGANGRMGQALLRLCHEDPAVEVVAAVSRKVGQRVIDGVPRFSSSELAGAPEFDVAIDFSLPEAFDAIVETCQQRGKPLVSGTTGLSDAQRSLLQQASGRCAVLWASNFSLGIAVLVELVRTAATALPHWSCDIVESHHVHKKDAPSGTALTLGDAAAVSGVQPHYASLRAGDIVGEHLVQFTGQGERLELVHRATNRDVFAHGALTGAKWLAGRPPGRYRLVDLLG